VRAEVAEAAVAGDDANSKPESAGSVTTREINREQSRELYRERAMSNLKDQIGADGDWRYLRLRVIATLVFCLLLASSALAEGPASQQVFNSPATAATALVTAAKNDDMNTLGSILGSDAKEILSSGDPVADKNARDNFVTKYNEMHRLAYDDQGRVIIYLGAENWPLPIPLVKKDGGWVFDTASEKQELLYRRIGRNEIYTIGVLEDLAKAQEEYARELLNEGGVKHFAQKILSDQGKRNGLYWPAVEGQPESPIGPLVASATAEGYKKESEAAIPFHGYYFKVLTRQGKNAPGGAKNYMTGGKMTKGFAFLAYPAEYRSSGVMTFMINQDGVVVQKDLGPNTTAIASQTKEFNPDKSWDQVVDTDEEIPSAWRS
jgi:Protein of unknown function (DUF2950)